jgi:hypothetical protein
MELINAEPPQENGNSSLISAEFAMSRVGQNVIH